MTASFDPRRIAVVVTAYNYGHYLPVCLDSVLCQTRPADEIIVIDDGSTDDTAAVLEPYADRVRIVHCQNGGQASAFNRGFAETSSDIVYFLDADDLLHTHALQTILLTWSPDMASMIFGLELVDGGGTSLGPLRLWGGRPLPDCRPDVLLTGSYPFPPTSGNVFSRAFLQAALPMPEPRWRISADCFLVRAAALFGRIGSTDAILGGYRVHSSNNYSRLSTGRENRGLELANRRDVIDALRDIARAPDDALLGGPPAEVREALTVRAGLIETFGDGHYGQPFERFGGLLTPRWLPVVAPDEVHEVAKSRPLQSCSQSFGKSTRLTLQMPVAVGPLSIQIALDHPRRVPLSVMVNGAPGAQVMPGATEFDLSLPQAPFDPARIVRIEMSADDEDPPPEVLTLEVITGRHARHAPILRQDPEPAGPVLAPGADSWAWSETPKGALALRQEAGGLRLAGPMAGPARLILDLAEPVPEGRLTIEMAGQIVFDGQLGESHRIAALLDMPEAADAQLWVRFKPDDTDGDPFAIAATALRPRAAGSDSLPVCAGESVTFLGHAFAGSAVGRGWYTAPGFAPQTAAAEATLSLDLPEPTADLAIRLHVSPLFPPPAGHSLIFGVSRDEEMLARAELLGPGDLVVPMGAKPLQGPLELTLHSILTDGEEAQFAPIELTAFEIGGRTLQTGRPIATPGRQVPEFTMVLEASRAILTGPNPTERMADLAACRAKLVHLIGRSNVALPLLLLGSEASAQALVDLGAATRGTAPAAAERAALEAAPEGTDAGHLARSLAGLVLQPAWRHPFAGDLARLPVAFRTCPEAIGTWLGAAPQLETEADHAAWRAYLQNLLTHAIAAIEAGPDAPLYDLATAAISYLRATPMIFGEADVTALAGLQSRAIERVLAEAGKDLTVAPALRHGLRRLRLGVLVRDVTETPEGWALRGMYDGLDTALFEPILIRMADDGLPAPTPFISEICLAGLSVDACVARIRDLELDLFVTGAYARDFETVTAIYAHRLATLQIWHTAVCPTTSGLSSFDAALTCPTTEGPEPQTQYLEPVHLLPDAAPCAYAFPAPDLTESARHRADLAIGDGQVMLISSAMAHKITDQVIASWGQILTACPSAVLVLAPFAPNWSMPADPDRFAARLIGAGVPKDQLIICPSMAPERLRALMAAADLALDSFPYTGATTVCEALSVGTPVISRAGTALRQLTGPGWLQTYGLDELIARSSDGYVALAKRLIQDPPALQQIANRVAEAASATPPPHDDRAGFGAAYSRALVSVAKASGRFPDLALPTTDVAFRPTVAPPAPAVTLRAVRPRLCAILTSPRSGSSLLCAVLNRTPGILCHLELFHDDMIQFAREVSYDADAIAERNADPIGFLDGLRSRAGKEGVHVIGFKHFAHLDESVAQFVSSDPDATLIHLHRDNLLAQYSSEKLAQASKEWTQHEDRGDPQPQLTFDAEDFQRFVQYQRRVELQRLNTFAQTGAMPLFVEYTRLSEPDTRDRIGRHLGVTIPDGAMPDIQKQNSTDILSRFTEPNTVGDFLVEAELWHWASEG